MERKIFFFSIILIFLLLWASIFCYYFISTYKTRKKTKIPYVHSFDKDLLNIKENIILSPWKTIGDLWCGDGKALRFFMKHYTCRKWIGWDLHKFAIFWWSVKNKIYGHKNISLEVKDFTKESRKECDIIYCYLFPELMTKISKQLKEKTKKGTIVIANTFPLSKDRTPEKIIKTKKSTIYLYKT